MTEEKTRRELILDTVDDLVTSLLWDERKEDEDLPRGAIEEALEAGEVSEAELVARFGSSLLNALGSDVEAFGLPPVQISMTMEDARALLATIGPDSFTRGTPEENQVASRFLAALEEAAAKG